MYSIPWFDKTTDNKKNIFNFYFLIFSSLESIKIKQQLTITAKEHLYTFNIFNHSPQYTILLITQLIIHLSWTQAILL